MTATLAVMLWLGAQCLFFSSSLVAEDKGARVVGGLALAVNIALMIALGLEM